jgi:ABC-type transport system substrate-binding protein
MKLTRRRLMQSSAGIAAASYLPLTSREADAQARVLVVAAPGTPEGLDGDALRPGTQEAVVQIYEGLTRYGRRTVNGRPFLNPDVIEGHLAESWTTSQDGKTWTFKLREGVKSFYGNELTAADVEWSWAKSFAQQRTGRFIANVSNVTAVKAKSRYEAEFTLSAPSAILLNTLTLYVPGIYDSTEVRKHVTADDPWGLKWMETNSAGFGAYHLESVRPNEQAVFVANPNYFRPQPYFTRVIYRAVPSPANRLTLLRAGQCQWIDRASAQQVVELRQDRRVKVEDSSGRAIASVRMNMTIRPFDDVRVRRAFNHAINKETLAQAVFQGTAEPALSIVPPIVGAYDPSFFAYNYDPAKARQLLAEAGVASSGPEIELIYSNIWWWEEAMAIQVSDQLKAVGANVVPRRITGSDLRARAAPARQDLALFTFEDGPIVLDPVYSMYLLCRSDGVSNRAKYNNPRVDALIDQGRQSLDRERRYTAMREAQRLWMEDAPWILTHYPKVYESMATNVSGWCPHPDDHERWVDLRVG